MSTNDEDWRLLNQEDYLSGVKLQWKEYRRYSETWDHDHCAFCWDKFAEADHIPEALHSGYATEDDYYWICKACFDDFRDRFKWEVEDK